MVRHTGKGNYRGRSLTDECFLPYHHGLGSLPERANLNLNWTCATLAENQVTYLEESGQSQVSVNSVSVGITESWHRVRPRPVSGIQRTLQMPSIGSFLHSMTPHTRHHGSDSLFLATRAHHFRRSGRIVDAKRLDESKFIRSISTYS